jgi:hypothetical protein
MFFDPRIMANEAEAHPHGALTGVYWLTYGTLFMMFVDLAGTAPPVTDQETPSYLHPRLTKSFFSDSSNV